MENKNWINGFIFALKWNNIAQVMWGTTVAKYHTL